MASRSSESCAVVGCPANVLRREIHERAAQYAHRHRLLHALSHSAHPSVLFGVDVQGRHGNFLPESYRGICARPEWSARLEKPHTGSRRSRAWADWSWRELDCAASSAALLVNVFCYPGFIAAPSIQALLGITGEAEPVFGVRPRLRLAGDRKDTTEADMQLGDLLVEAKLTENGFQTAPPRLIERLSDMHRVFDVERLPRTHLRPGDPAWDEGEHSLSATTRGTAGNFAHYQLIRGVLAAHAGGSRFAVICDGRRADLQQAWLSVLAAVSHADLRWRLQLVTWQELAASVPTPMQMFLAEKYGIYPAAPPAA